MKIISNTPHSSGIRHQIKISKNLLAKKSYLLKNLNHKIKVFAGRSSLTGHITVSSLGGGCKKKIRKIQIYKLNTKAVVLSVNYDPFRSSFISLSFDFLTKKFLTYLTTQSTYPGTLISCNKSIELFLGNQAFLGTLPIGVYIHSVGCSALRNLGTYSRSAGTFCQVIQKQDKVIQVRIPSGNIVALPKKVFATFGRVSNFKHSSLLKGKAGKMRYKGVRPTTRGIAMNPVDHPHGGKTNGGKPSTTP